MIDPYAPTPAELAAWCSEPGAIAPAEDWDLIITDADNIPVIFDLAMKTHLPGAKFFLGCLYLFVGDAFRTDFRAFPRALVESYITRIHDGAPATLQDWKKRSIKLIEGEEQFDYSLWCGHGYARGVQNAG